MNPFTTEEPFNFFIIMVLCQVKDFFVFWGEGFEREKC